MLTANNILDALDELISCWREERHRRGDDIYGTDGILERFEIFSRKLHDINDAQKSLYEDNIMEKVKNGELIPYPVRMFANYGKYEILLMSYKEKRNEK